VFARQRWWRRGRYLLPYCAAVTWGGATARAEARAARSGLGGVCGRLRGGRVVQLPGAGRGGHQPRAGAGLCLWVGRRPRGCHTGAGGDNGIDHDKNWLRFPYVSTSWRPHHLPPHPPHSRYARGCSAPPPRSILAHSASCRARSVGSCMSVGGRCPVFCARGPHVRLGFGLCDALVLVVRHGKG
jgi:hypothetical protein